jgi:hypothetical protein
MRIGPLLGMAVGLVACAESPVAPLRVLDQAPPLAAVNTSERLTLPFSRTVFVACANDGLGEDVALSGELEIHLKTSEDADGGLHVLTHVRPSHVEGVGEETGATYRGHGGTIANERYYPGGLQESNKFVNIFRIIGQGPGNNLQVHMGIHQRWDANGVLTHETSIDHSECN